MLCVEVKEQTVDTIVCGRPTVTAAGGITQPAVCPMAVARGGYFRLFREATQLKTVAAVARVAVIEARHDEIQVHAIGTADRRRPAVPAAADAPRYALPARTAEVAEAWGGIGTGRTPKG